MSGGLATFWSIDLPAVAAAVLSACTCALLGNFLVLRRMAMLGDAISHAVLPGIVGSFLVMAWVVGEGEDARAPWAMMLGAGVAGLVAAGLVEVVRRVGKVEPGAALGVVFSFLFALGVVLMERAARNVDLDADCVLYGALEGIRWDQAAAPGAIWRWETWAAAPRQVTTLAAMAAVAVAAVAAFFKELRLAAFDPGLAGVLGFPAWAINLALTLLVAAATVASFEAVGSILVVATLVCPPAAARQLTDRLAVQVWLSVAIAGACAVVGYAGAVWAPALWGSGDSVQAAGMIAVVCGGALVAAMVASPSHGVVARVLRRRRLAANVAREDLLALLFRCEEDARTGPGAAAATELLGGGRAERGAVADAARRGEIEPPGHGGGPLRLTEAGRRGAADVVRSHRLWEAWLVSEMGSRPDHVHRTAETLEHLREEQQRLTPDVAAKRDPHDRPIPEPPA